MVAREKRGVIRDFIFSLKIASITAERDREGKRGSAEERT